MNKDEILKRAIDCWGERAQLEMAQEEATELALACRKFIRIINDDNFNNLGSEIADVEIMIEQIKFMFPKINQIIEEQKVFKLTRLEKRLEANDFDLKAIK